MILNIKVARQIIRALLIRLAMPRKFKAKTPKEFMTVYQIQDSAGSSPWSAWVNETWRSMEDAKEWMYLSKLEGNPLPENDLSFDERDMKVYERKNFSKKFLFSFLDDSQYKNWFTSRQIELLEGNGFKLTPVKAKEVYASNTQAFYIPYE